MSVVSGVITAALINIYTFNSSCIHRPEHLVANKVLAWACGHEVEDLRKQQGVCLPANHKLPRNKNNHRLPSRARLDVHSELGHVVLHPADGLSEGGF